MEVSEIAIEAQRAKEKGYLDRAVSYYLEAERLEPHNPTWPRECADAHRLMGNVAEQVEALNRAARRYAAAGLVLKAVVALKAALAADPRHAASRRALEKLQLLTQPGARPGPAPARPLAKIPAEGSRPLAIIPLVRATRASLPGIRELSFDEPATAAAPPPGPDGRSTSSHGLRDPDDFDIDILPPIPLLSSLDPATFQAVVDGAKTLELGDGAVVFRQGDRSDALYVITEGSAAVFLEGPPRRAIARLAEGDFFGEIAVFTGRPRSATVEAVGRGVFLEIGQRTILELAKKDGAVLGVLMAFLRDRLCLLVFREHALFRELDEADRAALVRHFHVLDVPEDARMIEQGQPSDGLFVLVDGSASVVKRTATGRDLVALLDAGHLFGELSLLTGRPAVADVVAQERSVVLKLDRAGFERAQSEIPALRRITQRLAVERLRELGEAATPSAPPPAAAKIELV